MRILSLLPSSTEVLCALEFEQALVGRSHDSDYPDAVQQLPVVTQPRTQKTGPRDDSLAAFLEESLSVYDVDIDAIRQLAPDVIVTQVNTARSVDELADMLAQWLDKPVSLVALAPQTLNDAFNDMKALAKLLGEAKRGEDLVRNLQRRMVITAQRAKMLNVKPSVALIDWLDPAMLAGGWMPTLVEMAGGVAVSGAPGSPSEPLNWDNLLKADPDVILIVPIDHTLQDTQAHLDVLTHQKAWGQLRAVREGHAYIADGQAYFNRPGPRLVESLEILAEIMHPEAFSYGHADKHWQPI